MAKIELLLLKKVAMALRISIDDTLSKRHVRYSSVLVMMLDDCNSGFTVSGPSSLTTLLPVYN
jgi:hypothetical protein